MCFHRAVLTDAVASSTAAAWSRRSHPIRHDKLRYRDRWRAGALFCSLKDFRRVVTLHDKPARSYASTVALAAVVTFGR